MKIMMMMMMMMMMMLISQLFDQHGLWAPSSGGVRHIHIK
jgi:hypothetical protein